MRTTPPPPKPTLLGQAAEEAAARLLQRAGLTILARNYRCKMGEIDIVARDGDRIIFVEVRRRSHCGFGTGLDTVDKRKQHKLVRTATLFLQEQQFFDRYPCRFDIVSVQSPTQLNWVQDAFQAT